MKMRELEGRLLREAADEEQGDDRYSTMSTDPRDIAVDDIDAVALLDTLADIDVARDELDQGGLAAAEKLVAARFAEWLDDDILCITDAGKDIAFYSDDSPDIREADGGDTAVGPHGSKPLTDPDDAAVEQALLDRLAEVDIPAQELSSRELHVADMIVDTGFAEWIGPKGDVLSITSEGEAYVLGINEHAGDRFQYTDADVAHLAHGQGAHDPDDAEVERALLDMLIDGDQYKDQLSNEELHVADMLVDAGHAEWIDEMGNADPNGFLLALTPGGETYAWSKQPKTDDPDYWDVGDDDREVDAAKPGLNKESAAKPKHKGKSTPAEKKTADKTLKSLEKKAKTFKGKAKQMDWADDPSAAVGALYAKAGRDPKKEVTSNDAVWDVSKLLETYKASKKRVSEGPAPGTYLTVAEFGMGWAVVRGGLPHDQVEVVKPVKSKRAGIPIAKKIAATTGEPVR